MNEKFDSFQEIEFPDSPDCDLLIDWYGDLIEVDMFYAGIISNLIRGEKVALSLEYLLKLEKDFEAVQKNIEDKNLLKVYADYLNQLKLFVLAHKLNS